MNKKPTSMLKVTHNSETTTCNTHAYGRTSTHIRSHKSPPHTHTHTHTYTNTPQQLTQKPQPRIHLRTTTKTAHHTPPRDRCSGDHDRGATGNDGSEDICIPMGEGVIRWQSPRQESKYCGEHPRSTPPAPGSTLAWKITSQHTCKRGLRNRRGNHVHS